MTLEEFVAESKKLGKTKEETIAKAEELKAKGYFSSNPVSTEGMELTDKIQAVGQKLLDGVTFGLGDEISAAGRAVVDTAQTGSNLFDNYNMYVEESRELEKEFQSDSPYLSAGLEIGSSLVPAFKIGALAGNASTRLGNVARQGALAGAEMGVREVGEGEGGLISRMADVDPLVVGLGTLAGAAGGALMRGQKSVDALMRAQREAPGALGRAIQEVRDDIYTVAAKEVGEEPARKMVSADARATRWKQDLHHPDRLPVNKLDNLTKVLSSNGKVSKLLADAGATKLDAEGNRVAVFSADGRKRRIDHAVRTLKETDPEAAQTLENINKTISSVQRQLRMVFPKAASSFEDGYFPLYAKADDTIQGYKRGTNQAATDSSTQARTTGFISEAQAIRAFENPVNNFMTFFEDTVDAIALARTYGVRSNSTFKQLRSYTDSVVSAIVADRKKAGMPKDKAETLGNFLRTYTIDGRSGMGQLATMLRTLSHTALLGTPENALLQAGDMGQAAYANSFASAIKALPKALKSVILTDGDMVVHGWRSKDSIRMADLGLTRQHLTEMVNQNRSVWGRGVAKMSDVVMSASGVRKANRLGVETHLNAQLGMMRSLANKGRDALSKSEFAEGLDNAELDRLYKGILSGNSRNPSVLDAAFFRIGRFQPVSRTAMPTAYLKARNGRLLWSMKLYMVKMASQFQKDVLDTAMEAERLGINTPAGRKMLGKAVVNTGRYSTFILALNSLVDPGRKELFRGKESENTYGEEFLRQTASFATGGLVDSNMIEYGGLEEGLMPPAVGAAYAPINLALKYLKDGEVSPSEMNRAAMFVPGLRQYLWTREVIEANE